MILFVCDKNECTCFERLTLNLVKAVTPEWEAHVLWLKTLVFFQFILIKNLIGYIVYPRFLDTCVIFCEKILWKLQRKPVSVSKPIYLNKKKFKYAIVTFLLISDDGFNNLIYLIIEE